MPLVDITTSTHTFFANGLATHNCYARVLSNRMGWAEWGAGKPRHRTKNWRDPLKWDRRARGQGVMTKTFAFSLADFFDAEVPMEWRLDYIEQVIKPTTNTWWLIATKRPSIAKAYRDILPWEKIWLIVSVGSDKYAYRLKEAADLPAKVLAVSYEPAIGPLSVANIPGAYTWAIIGGESIQAGKCRPFELQWAREIIANRPPHLKVFVKQLGGKPMRFLDGPWPITDSHGANIEEWPSGLCVREFPLP